MKKDALPPFPVTQDCIASKKGIWIAGFFYLGDGRCWRPSAERQEESMELLSVLLQQEVHGHPALGVDRNCLLTFSTTSVAGLQPCKSCFFLASPVLLGPHPLLALPECHQATHSSPCAYRSNKHLLTLQFMRSAKCACTLHPVGCLNVGLSLTASPTMGRCVRLFCSCAHFVYLCVCVRA